MALRNRKKSGSTAAKPASKSDDDDDNVNIERPAKRTHARATTSETDTDVADALRVLSAGSIAADRSAAAARRDTAEAQACVAALDAQLASNPALSSSGPQVVFGGTSGQGGVCKEFLKRGTCKYGDECLYIHDREVSGNSAAVARRVAGQMKEQAERKLSGLLCEVRGKGAAKKVCGKCGVGRKKGGSCALMQLGCGHRFCEGCAVGHCLEQCATCKAPSGGAFETVNVE